MTEFDLGATLGLMPAADMEELPARQIRGGTGQRCELYLRRADVPAALARAAAGGGKLLDGLRDRWWGERVGYAIDPDGHALALAVPAGPGGELADLSWREEGLAAIQEAATISRELAARWLDICRHELEHLLQIAAWSRRERRGAGE